MRLAMAVLVTGAVGLACVSATSSTPCTTTCFVLDGGSPLGGSATYNEIAQPGVNHCTQGDTSAQWSGFSDVVELKQGVSLLPDAGPPSASQLELTLNGAIEPMNGTLYSDLSASFNPVLYTNPTDNQMGVLRLAGQFNSTGTTFSGTYFFEPGADGGSAIVPCTIQGITTWTQAP